MRMRAVQRKRAARIAALVGLLVAGCASLTSAEGVKDPPKAKAAQFDRRDFSGTWDR